MSKITKRLLQMRQEADEIARLIDANGGAAPLHFDVRDPLPGKLVARSAAQGDPFAEIRAGRPLERCRCVRCCAPTPDAASIGKTEVKD